MADKSTQLIIDALSRAAADPAGLPLFASKSEPGLFPSTSTARTAADRARTDGLLQVVPDAGARLSREIGILTDKGRQYLVRQCSPRQVIEDLVRVLEDRQSAIDDLGRSAARMAESLTGIRQLIAEVLPRLNEVPNGVPMNGVHVPARPAASTATDALIADLKATLAEWHAASGPATDCPLPDLYRRLDSADAVSIGMFHDALRQLHDDSQVYLHPWTGPLYTLPEPAFALMIGHEVAYYASIR